MKFSVGYAVHDNADFISEIVQNREHIEEVYFSWGDFANGRNSQTEKNGMTSWESQEKQISDLFYLHEKGIKFNLLFNGNCFGKDSLSRAFFNKAGETVDYIKTKMNLSSVTTTSPIIAKFIKNNFEDIAVRASVNMEIGTVQGMDYLAGYFDGYYMKREFNRDFKRIRELKSWCEDNGKTLHILANSGCLNNCSAHIFHDNLVAHESEIAKMDNCYTFSGICHEYLQNPQKRVSLIRDTNFIRPEDVRLYEEYFSSMKLATRVSNKAALILKSYINGCFHGNILELLEPNHAGRIYPYIIENDKIENDYLYCGKDCKNCGRCEEVFQSSVVNIEKWMEG